MASLGSFTFQGCEGVIPHHTQKTAEVVGTTSGTKCMVVRDTPPPVVRVVYSGIDTNYPSLSGLANLIGTATTATDSTASGTKSVVVLHVEMRRLQRVTGNKWYYEIEATLAPWS